MTTAVDPSTAATPPTRFAGLGQSTGQPTYARQSLAKDARDVADHLGIERAS